METVMEERNTARTAAWLSSIASLVIERHIDERREGASNALAVGRPTKARRLRDQWAMVEPYVKSLAPRQRQVVRLRFREAMCYADIAGRLGVPIGTVRSRLARARIAIDELSRDSAGFVSASTAESGGRGPARSANRILQRSPGL